MTLTSALLSITSLLLECAGQFALLLVNLVSLPSGASVDVTRALVRHEGLLDFLVRSIFWGSNRPDILALGDRTASVCGRIFRDSSFNSDESAVEMIGFTSAGILAGMMGSVKRESWCKYYFEIEDRTWISAAASTATVNTLYDESCVESFVSGIIRLITEKPTCEDAESWIDCLQRTVLAGGIDADVIKGMIRIGNGRIHSLKRAVHICRAAMDVMFTVDDCPTKKNAPSDTYVAYAVNKGIIEMFLGILSRFGLDADLWAIAIGSVDMVSEVSTQPKTSKALRNLSKRKGFVDALASAERDPRFNGREGARLLTAIRWVVPSAERVCLGCKKTVPAKEAKSCSRCHAIYCGRECQGTSLQMQCLSLRQRSPVPQYRIGRSISNNVRKSTASKGSSKR